MNTPSSRTASVPPPPLVIDTRDYDRLRALAERALDTAPDVAQYLLDEVDRADVMPPELMPGSVVRIGSLVTYQDAASGSIRTVRLVLPPDADLAAMRVSVISPIGAALIGLREGQSIAWQLRDGLDRVLTVTRVLND
ncbi:MAG TPA: nucleoside diphosphate kinase regulator [Solimonas sp.]